MLMLTNT